MIVPLETFEPRAGYLFYDADGDGDIDAVTDPSAAPEDFSWRWYGRAEGWTIALTVEKGVVAGRIWGPTTKLAVAPRPTYTQAGVVNSHHWEMHDGDTETDVLPSDGGYAVAGQVAAPWVLAGGWDAECRLPVSMERHVIDVLVMYTQRTLDSYGTETRVRAVVQSAIDDANQSLKNSLVDTVTFSLRGVEFIGGNYDDPGTERALHTFGGFFPSGSEPYMTFPGNAYVQARRNELGADVVALARESFELSCGASQIQRKTTTGYIYEPGAGFEKFGYLVFNPGCGADRLNLAHELGHQLGMEHDPRNSETTWSSHFPSCPWSYGHRRSSGPDGYRFRTIMSDWRPGRAARGPEGCERNGLCPVIDAFSQPSLVWANGSLRPLGYPDPEARPIGVATESPTQAAARGHDTVARLAPIVEAFRARPDAIFSNGFEP